MTGDFQQTGLPPPGTPCVGGCVEDSGYWGANYCYTSAAKSGQAWGAPCIASNLTLSPTSSPTPNPTQPPTCPDGWASSDCSVADSVRLAAVYLAQTHVQAPDTPNFKLIGNRSALLKVQAVPISGETGKVAPIITATVTVSKGGCKDTAGWGNGHGWNCNTLAKDGFLCASECVDQTDWDCFNGKAVAPKKFHPTQRYPKPYEQPGHNFPELHCCACGKEYPEFATEQFTLTLKGSVISLSLPRS